MKEAAARLDDAQWDRIARQAGGRRSGGDCRCHWAVKLAANRSPWTREEDQEMARVAECHGNYNVPPPPSPARARAHTRKQTQTQTHNNHTHPVLLGGLELSYLHSFSAKNVGGFCYVSKRFVPTGT